MTEIIKSTITNDIINSSESFPKAGENFLGWVKAHRKQLIMAGVSIATLIGIVYGLKNKDALAELWRSLSSCLNISQQGIATEMLTTENTAQLLDEVPPTRAHTLPTERFVGLHTRILPEGQHHSPMKAAEAKALGIDLLPNQTIVDSYTRYVA